jgi:hypothetical protein
VEPPAPIGADLVTGVSVISIPDVDGDGLNENAVLGADAEGQPHLVIVTAAGVTLDRPLRNSSFVPVDLVDVGNVGASPATDIAVLLGRDGEASALLIVDAGSGEVISKRGLGIKHDWIDIEVLDRGPDVTSIALLATNPGTANWIVVFDAQSTNRIEVIRVARGMTPIDLEVLPDFMGGQRSELAVLGLTSRGSVVAVIDGTQITRRRVRMASDFRAADLEIVEAGGTAAPDLAVVGHTAGDLRLEIHDAGSGGAILAAGVPLADVLDMEATGDLDGSGATDLAILGHADDGTATVILADAATGRVLGGPVLPPAPVDVAAVPQSTDLAVLRNDSTGPVVVSHRDGLTGAAGDDVVVSR